MGEIKSEYRTLFSKLNCAIMVIDADADLTIHYANPAFYRSLQVTAEEVKYRFADRLSAMLDTKVTKTLHDFIDSRGKGGILSLEHTLRGDKSDQIWFMTEVNGLHLEETGQLLMILFNIERYKAKELVHLNSLAQSDYLIDNSGIDFLEYDCKTKHIREIKAKHFALNRIYPDMLFLESMLEQELVAPEDYEKFCYEAERINKEKDRALFEVRVKAQDGHYRWARVSLGCLKYGRRLSVIAMFTDISAEKEVTMKYLDETLFYSSVLSDQDGYMHLDVTEDKIIKVGGLWDLYYELIDKETLSELFDEFKNKVVQAEDREHYVEVMNQKNMLDSFENGVEHLECEIRRMIERGKMAWMKITIHMFLHPLSRHVMSLIYIKNIEEKKYNEVALNYESQRDALTGLLNRRSVENSVLDYLDCMKAREICAFLLLDIHGFRRFNSEHGFQAGDRVLVELAGILKKVFCRQDILGRFSGDEYLVFLKNVDDSVDVKMKVESVLELLNQELEPEITGSVGITFLCRKDTFEAVYKRAMTALDTAKSQGVNTYHFYRGISLVSEYMEEVKEIVGALAAEEEAQLLQNIEYGSGSYRDREGFEAFTNIYGDMAYLVEPKTYELICGNQAMYNRLGKTPQECHGLACYEILHNRTRPCAVCRSSNWSRDRFYIYKCYNDFLEQEFLIKNKLVTWKNKQVLFAVAIDMSNDKNIVNSIVNITDENGNILSGIQNMQDSISINEMINSALETIGTFYRAGRVRFWRHADIQEQYYCEACWSQKMTSSACIEITDKENQIFNQWFKTQALRECLYIESQETMLCKSYDMYSWMKENEIENQRWIMLYNGEEIVGVAEVDNMTINFQNHSFLESFLNFVSSEWKKRLLAEDMVYTSFHDALTGVLNRNSYEMYLKKYNADNVSSIAAIVININGLKKINAEQGIDIGNNCLKKLSNILILIYGRTRVFRMNGDEFLALMPNEELSFIENNVKSMNDMISNENSFTVAVGYNWEYVEKTLEPVVETATCLMRINKRNYYESGNFRDNKDRAEILGEILKFIEGNEMEVFLQPKVDINLKKMVGAEALVRIRDAEQGIIPPSKFIGVLEKNNLIRYVDLFVFEEVCRMIETWQQDGKECPVVSVNFSRVTLMELDLTNTMEQIFKKYNIEKRFIEIEITESFEDIGKSRLYQAAENIFRIGFSISLDDFGTKYTNLSILSDIEVNVLKLDRSLICSMVESHKNQIILKYVIEMCDELGIDVIAEGVETQAQEDMLKTLGCHLIQGYLYSKPIEVKKFEELFMRQGKKGS